MPIQMSGMTQKGMSDQEVMRLIGVSETFSEGLLFPDTYLFAKQSRDIDVLSRAYRTMQRHLAREWETRAADLPIPISGRH